MSLPTLMLGFREVAEFGPNDEYELSQDGSVVEEVSYVTLDLGAVEPTLVPSTETYRLIGLDTPTPFLQLSGTIFQGRHDELLGSELFFETQGTGDQTDSQRHVTYLGTTSQRVAFKPVELVRKAEAPPQALGRDNFVNSGPDALTAAKKGKGNAKAKKGDVSLDRMIAKEVPEVGPSGRIKRTRKKESKNIAREEMHSDEGKGGGADVNMKAESTNPPPEDVTQTHPPHGDSPRDMDVS